MGGLELICGRSTFDLGSVLVQQAKQLRATKTKHERKAKRTPGIEGQVATMLESHQEKIVTTDTTSI